MSSKLITQKDVAYVANLARIAVAPEEIGPYEAQLERILEYVSQLKKVDTEAVPPTAHPHAVANVWREDAAKPFDDVEGLLANAPEKEETFFKVKKVIE